MPYFAIISLNTYSEKLTNTLLTVQKETLEALLKSVIEPTLQEEGCLKYELYISENDSSRYFFLEEWRSREDLDIHLASDYIQSLFGNIQSLIESSDIIEIKKI